MGIKAGDVDGDRDGEGTGKGTGAVMVMVRGRRWRRGWQMTMMGLRITSRKWMGEEF